jgi:membrane-associated protease RseP (regulator of RpoE activity)
MTSDQINVAPPGPAAPAPLTGEALYRAVTTIIDTPVAEEPLSRKLRVFVISLILMVAYFVYWTKGGIRQAALLISIIFIHEFGHFLGMRWFGYRNTKIAFVPFFGGVATGVRPNAPAWQQAIILLLGPLPGILLGAGLMWFGGERLLVAVGYAFLLINALNLAPVVPLDGGQLLRVLFFAHSRWLALGFTWFGAACLALYAWASNDWLIGGLAVLMAISTSQAFQAAKITDPVRAEGLRLPDEFEQLDDAQRRDLFVRALTLYPDREPYAVVGRMRALHTAVVARVPSPAVALLFFAIYLAGIVISAWTLMAFWQHN